MSPRRSYRAQLQNLQDRIHQMSEMTVAQLDGAVEVLGSGDVEAAQTVVDADHDLNDLYLDIEHQCIELLALQQPVAGDLRLIAASFKIITDLERVGDLAVNLAQYAEDEEETAYVAPEIEALATVAREMLLDAMTAYEEENATMCRAIYRRDDELDARCRAAGEDVVRKLLADEPATLAEDEVRDVVASASRALLTIRDLERVGDHAVNIAARTYYMIENDDELIY